MKLRLKWLFIIGLLFMVGCNQEEENSLATEEKNDNQIVQIKNSDPGELQELDSNEIATHLANVAGDVPNVNDASAVIAGSYAVVGIDVDKDLDRSRVGTIKYSVLEALHHDPYGKTAVVVADADVMERIRGMNNKIRQGYPVQGIVDELAAIVGRYMPDFPISNDQPQEPDQNKEIMSEEDEQKLDKIQGDQSNHRDE